MEAESKLPKLIIQPLKDYPKKSMALEDGSYYNGQFNHNGQREGKGILIYQDGTKFEGLFKDDQINGLGRIIFKNGDHYTGDFFDGKFHGYGIYETKNGFKYTGEWEDGQRHGYSVEVWPDTT